MDTSLGFSWNGLYRIEILDLIRLIVCLFFNIFDVYSFVISFIGVWRLSTLLVFCHSSTWYVSLKKLATWCTIAHKTTIVSNLMLRFNTRAFIIFWFIDVKVLDISGGVYLKGRWKVYLSHSSRQYSTSKMCIESSSWLLVMTAFIAWKSE